MNNYPTHSYTNGLIYKFDYHRADDYMGDEDSNRLYCGCFTVTTRNDYVNKNKYYCNTHYENYIKAHVEYTIEKEQLNILYARLSSTPTRKLLKEVIDDIKLIDSRLNTRRVDNKQIIFTNVKLRRVKKVEMKIAEIVNINNLYYVTDVVKILDN